MAQIEAEKQQKEGVLLASDELNRILVHLKERVIALRDKLSPIMLESKSSKADVASPPPASPLRNLLQEEISLAQAISHLVSDTYDQIDL